MTQEGRGVLVAEDKGMQAYKDICRAVAQANLPVKSAQSNHSAAPVKSAQSNESTAVKTSQSNDPAAPVKLSIDSQSNDAVVQSNDDPALLLPLLAPHGCIIFQGS